MKVSVSILGLNDRKKAISLLNNTNCDYIHIDVMDGSFVPNKQFTTEEINNLEIISKKKFDVHLMVDNPREYIENLDISNIEYIIVHSEIAKDINELLDLIKSYNIKCGLSIKPNTDISILTPYLNKLDLILVMSVEPGFSGQEFISNSLDRVSKLKQIIKNNNLDIVMAIDGGINGSNASLVKKSGIDMVVSGSYVTNSLDYQELLRKNEKVMSVLSDEELDSCFTLEYYQKNVEEILKRVGIL